jgi:hypothetical protein
MPNVDANTEPRPAEQPAPGNNRDNANRADAPSGPNPKWPSAAIGVAVAVAALGGLLMASLVGAGPAAIAGAAGYLAYRGLSRQNRGDNPAPNPSAGRS